MGEPNVFFSLGWCLERIKGNCGYTSTDAGFASGLFMIGAVTNGIQWQRKVMKLTVLFSPRHVMKLHDAQEDDGTLVCLNMAQFASQSVVYHPFFR